MVYDIVIAHKPTHQRECVGVWLLAVITILPPKERTTPHTLNVFPSCCHFFSFFLQLATCSCVAGRMGVLDI